MPLSATQLGRWHALNTLHELITSRLPFAYRFARDETDIISNHSHIERLYEDIKDRFEKYNDTCQLPDFSPSEALFRQSIRLYQILADLFHELIPHLTSGGYQDDERLTEEMLHLPYNGDIFDFKKKGIEMLHNFTVAMVPFLSAPPIKTMKEQKIRHKKMNDAIKAKKKENIRVKQAAVKAEKEKIKQAKNTEDAAKKKAKRKIATDKDKEEALKK